MNAQTYEINHLRAANVALANALEVAVITLERLANPCVSTLALARAALKNNSGASFET